MENKNIEQQLTKASQKEYWTRDCNNPTALREVDLQIAAFINGAKSEASKQYHSQKPVNLDELREEYEKKQSEGYFKFEREDWNDMEKIFDWFLPHLQQSEVKSDLLQEAIKSLQGVIKLKPYLIYSDNLSEDEAFAAEAQAIDSMILNVHETLDLLQSTKTK